jgi:copper chaperone CopZ
MVTIRRLTLPIEGFRCGGGGLMVERALAQVPGVRRVYVNVAMEMAYVEFETTVTEVSCLVTAVAHAGFRAGQPSMR